MMKYELLAPAGNIESAYAAINAGADAIYLGASKFSARAFADNFTIEEIVDLIKLSHLRDVAVYLTLNTLINSDEINEIPSILEPLYEAGLDGIIVQDLGVAKLVHDNYPKLELHASTQMSIMSSDGASMLGEYGFKRIVPSRELTLKEVEQIKADTGLELECFIHGAMCYSYSGLCLMSSMIGGRSGNRGKCAGTCRLPFRVNLGGYSTSEEEYPLSMKDMCTVEILPTLMDAGIDSFKIEGRMKSPEYVAGATSIYRKYMDRYIASGSKDFKVDQSDIEHLRGLYIRTGISRGYYEGKKGANLITLTSPGYNSSDEAFISELNAKYVHEPDSIAVDINVYAHLGMPFSITMIKDEYVGYYEGPICEAAVNAPLTVDRIANQVSKLGGTSFASGEVYVDTSGDVFIPMGVINECRRKCVEALENEILKSYGC